MMDNTNMFSSRNPSILTTEYSSKLSPTDFNNLREIVKDIADKPVSIPENLIDEEVSDRQWLKESIYDWIRTDEPDREIFWLLGGPGIGKSFLISSFCKDAGLLDQELSSPVTPVSPPHRIQGSDKRYRIAHHFFNSYDKKTSNPISAILLLFEQLQRMESDGKYLLPKQFNATEVKRDFSLNGLSSLELFSKYIFSPLNQRDHAPKTYIFLDAIEEMLNEKENRLLIQEIIRKIKSPDNHAIRLLITSRNPPEYYCENIKIPPFTFHSTDPRCKEDIEDYLTKHLNHSLVGISLNDYIKKKIWLSSAGNFLYLYYFCYLIEHDRSFTITDPQYPEGLNNMYRRVFQSLFGSLEHDSEKEYYSDHVMPYLSVLCMAKHPLEHSDFIEKIVKNHKIEAFSKFSKSDIDITKLIIERIQKVFNKVPPSLDHEMANRIDYHLQIIKDEKYRYKEIFEGGLKQLIDKTAGEEMDILAKYISWETQILEYKICPLFLTCKDGKIRPKHRSIVEWLTAFDKAE